MGDEDEEDEPEQPSKKEGQTLKDFIAKRKKNEGKKLNVNSHSICKERRGKTSTFKEGAKEEGIRGSR